MTIYEKNEALGGRARQFQAHGYTFDMGPSWYWMPDVFEHFFTRFDKKVETSYDLKRLDPGFQMIFPDQRMQIPSSWEEVKRRFEEMELGSAKQLELFMHDAAFKYESGVNSLVYKPSLSVKEFLSKDVLKHFFRLQLFSSYRDHVASYFKEPKLQQLMEFPVLFLGTAPKETAALYSLMAYAGLKQGTFYPMGGFGSVVNAFVQLCLDLGVRFMTETNVHHIQVKEGVAQAIATSKGLFTFDYLIAGADYQHVEAELLPQQYRNYQSKYWEKKTMSPSALLFYIGVGTKLPKLAHHNLFFDKDVEQHTQEIYERPQWPTDPLFYVCCPSKTDPSVAPEGSENLFVLMPLSAGLEDTDSLRDQYFQLLMSRLEAYVGKAIIEHIDYKRSYCIQDFQMDYNAYKGNAYGLANTLSQTAFLKPKIKNKKVDNLYYTGQLTVPGPGVPPAIISGQVVADHLLKQLNSKK